MRRHLLLQKPFWCRKMEQLFCIFQAEWVQNFRRTLIDEGNILLEAPILIITWAPMLLEGSSGPTWAPGELGKDEGVPWLQRFKICVRLDMAKHPGFSDFFRPCCRCWHSCPLLVSWFPLGDVWNLSPAQHTYYCQTISNHLCWVDF